MADCMAMVAATITVTMEATAAPLTRAISSAPLLLHHCWLSLSSSDEDRGIINNDDCTITTPKPDGVTFGMVLFACKESLQWNTALYVARAATEYGGALVGMALTLILHSCQQLGLADEAPQRQWICS